MRAGAVGMNEEGKISIFMEHLPPSELFPNNKRRTHWAIQRRATEEARQEAGWLGKMLQREKPMELVEIELLFRLKSRRVRDLDNLMAACKPYLDGLVDAGVMVSDDSFHVKKLSGSIVEGWEDGTKIIVREVEGAV